MQHGSRREEYLLVSWREFRGDFEESVEVLKAWEKFYELRRTIERF